MKDTIYLPQYTLDRLTNRVALNVDFFMNLFNSDNIWEGITEQCEKIEKEPRSVSSVIIEAKKSKGIAIGGSSITWYHTKLTRIYILLYYGHRDDDIYNILVFPELLSNMGIYSGDKIIKNKINDEIDKIIDIDKMMEKMQAEKKKEVKPVFAYVSHNGNELDHLYIEYSEEKLFRHMANIIKELAKRFCPHLDEANVWYNAKIVVHTLGDVNRPELLIRRAATALVNGQTYNGFEGSQIILLCAYAMILSSKDKAHFSNFIQNMESLSDADDTDFTVIKNTINALKNWITDNLPFDDYDYTGGSQKPEEMFSKADVDQMMQQYAAKIEELNRIVEKKDDIITECHEKLNTKVHEEDGEEEKEQEDVLYNKVCFEFFLLLLENSGFDINNTGYKTRVGELWHMFTGKSSDDLRRYCSTRNYNNNHTKVDIERLNEKLADMGLKIKL